MGPVDAADVVGDGGTIDDSTRECAFFVQRLRDGNLRLVRDNPPDWQPRSHLTAIVSDDEGNSWRCGMMLDKWVGVS
jgi:CubicO group peptidase (beta-lactamase class C family)